MARKHALIYGLGQRESLLRALLVQDLAQFLEVVRDPLLGVVSRCCSGRQDVKSATVLDVLAERLVASQPHPRPRRQVLDGVSQMGLSSCRDSSRRHSNSRSAAGGS
ncbi:hypothetical protein DMH04_32040 [Kibdelosporangium aridum]|uniref:Uncharacterized protein n=1 Tax=Kibdelosporangium aridum TaxID=2030 RepID=A0A428Z238_KIBAR|nr:hypothetical protein DMH04_32040 [Kibdelosporangium aridum]